MSDRSDRVCTRDPVIVSVDWGLKAAKRAAYVARPEGGWRISRLEPPRGGWSLTALLHYSNALCRQYRAPVLLGIDAVLGIPSLVASRLGAQSFRQALRYLDRFDALTEEARSPAAWSPKCPFFRVLPGAGGLSQFVDTAGGPRVLWREIDLRTRAKPVFALSGIPGTVGSGSRALWRELVAPPQPIVAEVSIWPFDGTIAELTAQEKPFLAEIYPRAAYATALCPKLPAIPLSIAKTKRSPREDALGRLEQAAWLTACEVRLEDSAAAYDCEDDFDALLTTAALVRLVAETRPLACELVDREHEGGILATGETCLKARRRPHCSPRSLHEPKTAMSSRSLRCPILGCQHVFKVGRSGWDGHVASIRIHPDWHPDVHDQEERKTRFRNEFADWIEG